MFVLLLVRDGLCFSHLSRSRLLAPPFSPFFPKKSILVRAPGPPRPGLRWPGQLWGIACSSSKKTPNRSCTHYHGVWERRVEPEAECLLVSRGGSVCRFRGGMIYDEYAA